MRVLMLSIVQPYDESAPPCGATTVTRALLRGWSEDWKDESENAAELRTIANRVGSPFSVAVRQIISVVKGALVDRPSKMQFQQTRSAACELRQAVEDGPWDLFIINGTDMWGLAESVLPKIRQSGTPLWLVCHNVEADLYRSQLKTKPGWVRRQLKRDLHRLCCDEAVAYRNADRVICICEEDRKRIQFAYSNLKTEICVKPLTFETVPFRHRVCLPLRDAELPLRLGFLANYKWWPNRAGLKWFCTEVWPHLCGEVRLTLYGPASESAAARRGPRIGGAGFCPNLDFVWGNVDMMICPVFSGGGVRIKNVETLWNRIPLLTSEFGMRGVPRNAQTRAMVRETAADWISTLNELIEGRQNLEKYFDVVADEPSTL